MAVRKRVWRKRTGETKLGWIADYVDEQGRRARRQFETKRQADAFRIEAEGQLRAGTYRSDGDRVTVQDAAEQFLAYCRGRMERRERMTRGNFEVYTGHPKPTDLVFPGRNGGYQNHGSLVRKRFYPLFAAMKEKHAADPTNCPKPPVRFNWHALRHFAVSCWIEAGLSPKTVQTFAGHSSLEMTMDRYGHLFKSDDHHSAMDTISTSAWLIATP